MRRRAARSLLAVVLISTGLSVVMFAHAQRSGAVGTSPLTNGLVTMVSTQADGTGGDPPGTTTGADDVSINGDGSAIAFTSVVPADKLVTDPLQTGHVADTNDAPDVFVYQKLPGPLPAIITLASWNSSHSGTGDAASTLPVMAPLGLGLVFTSQATNLVASAVAGNQKHLYAWVPAVSDAFPVFLVDGNADGSGAVSSIGSDPSISLLPVPTVVFESTGLDHVSPPLATNGGGDQIYAHNVVTGANTLVSADANGDPVAGGADDPMIAAFAPVVIFTAGGDDMTAGFTTNGSQIWERAVLAGGGVGPALLVSKSATGGAHGTSGNHDAVISQLGTSVAWMSNDHDNSTTPFDPAQAGHSFEHVFFQLLGGSTTMIDAIAGVGCDENSNNPGLSGDGTLVAFESGCTNLAANDDNHSTDVFSRRMFPDPIAADILPDAAPVLVSVNTDGKPSVNGGQLCSDDNDFVCLGDPSLNVNLDGTAIAFTGGPDIAPVPNPADHSYNGNIFVRYGYGLTPHTINVTTSNTSQNPQGTSRDPRITNDGGTVAFVSLADDLVPTLPPSDPTKVDANEASDAFVADIHNTYILSPLTVVTEGTDTTASIAIHRDGPVGSQPGTADIIAWSPGEGLAPDTPLPTEITDVSGTNATADDDFDSSSGHVLFPPGISDAVIEVPIMDDQDLEGPEFFHVTISADTGAVANLLPGPASSAYVLIQDDETPPQDWHVTISTPAPTAAQVGDTVSVGYTVSVDAGPTAVTVSSVSAGAGTIGLSSAVFLSPPTTVSGGATSPEATGTAVVTATPETSDVHLQLSVTAALGADPATTKSVDTAAITVADAVSAALTGGPATVGLGDPITYTLTFTNASDTAADLSGLPAALVPPAGTSGGTATGSTTVAPNSTTDWTLSVTVLAADGNGLSIVQAPTGLSYAMSAIPSLPSRPIASPASSTSTVAAPVVGVTAHTMVDENGGTLDPGDLVDVTVTVGNSGGASATATVVDTLTELGSPTNVKLDGSLCGGCSTTASSVTAPLGTLAAAGSHTVTYTATVPVSPGGSTASSSVVVTFTPATTGTSPTAADVKSATIGGVVGVQDWRVAITQQPPASAEVGDTVTVNYTIAVDVGADGLTGISVASGAGTAGLDTPAFPSAPTSLAAGATSAVLTGTARVVAVPGAPGVRLEVAVTATLGAATSTKTADSGVIASAEAVTGALSADGATVALDGQITYTLTFTNASDTAAEVSGVDTGLVAGSGSTATGAATGSLTVPANGTTDWTLVADVDDADADGAVITGAASGISYAMNSVSLGSRSVTVTPSSASTTVQAPVVAVSAHTLADQNHGTLDPGDTVGVSITVGNTGTGAATSATVDVTLANLFAPAGIEVDGAACGGCSSTSSTVTAPVGALAATTGSHVVTFTATVASAAPGSTVSTSATVTFVPATTGTSPTAASVASSTIGTISDTAPVALADAYTTDEDVPLTVDSAAGVLANDSDAELDVLHATLVSTAAAHGVVNLADDGSFDYTPAANFNGDATFTYSVSDGTLTGNTVTATITVTPVEDPPVLVDGGTATVTSGGQVHIYLTDFASDPDGDPLTFTITTPPAHGTMPCTPGGDCLYTPDSGFSGTDSFQFTASDGVEAAVAPAVTAGPVTVTITVTAEDTTSSSSSSTTSTTSGSGSGGSGSGAGGGGLARTGTNSLLPATALGGTLIAAGLLALGSERRANRRRSRWTHLRRRA